VIAASVLMIRGNLRIVRAAGCWGVWVGADAGLLIPLSVSAYARGGTEALAVLGTCRMLPAALATPLGADLADRMPRVQLLRRVLLVRAVLVALIPLSLQLDSLIGLYLVVSAAAAAGTAFTPAVFALLPQIVDRPEELAAGNSAYSILEAAGMLVGPLGCGLAVAATSADACDLGIAAAFAASAALTLGLHTESQPAARRPGGRWRRLIEPVAGFAVLIGRRKIRAVFAVFLAQTCTRGAFNVLVVAVAVTLLHQDVSSVGALVAALGAGGLVGAISTLVGTSWRPALPFCIGMALWGIPLLAVAASSSAAAVWIAISVIGVGNAIADVSGLGLFHLLIPDHLLGRAFGAFSGSAAAMQAIGAVLASALLAGVGVRGSLVVFGIAMTAVAGLSWLTLRTLDVELAVEETVVDMLRDCALFAPLTRVALEQLARGAEALEVSAGRTVIEQGSAGETFYVVASGELEALVDGRSVRFMTRGDCFGEIAALNRSARTATVRVVDDAQLLAIRGDTFVSAVTGQRSADRAAHALMRHRMDPDRAD
jgi:hypothetical protein